MTKEEAELELEQLLNDSGLSNDYEKLAKVALCYQILEKTDLAEKYYWKAYEQCPNSYSAIYLSQLYVEIEMVDALEKAFLRFATDEISMNPNVGLKLLAKFNRSDALKELLILNWGPIDLYLKNLYECREYEYSIEFIESRYQFDRGYLNKNVVSIFYYWLLCKIQLNQYEDIKKMFDTMPMAGKKSAKFKIALAAQYAENPDAFITVLEDLYAETYYSSKDIRMCLFQLYDKFGYINERDLTIKAALNTQKKLLEKIFSRLCNDLAALEAYDDIEVLNKYYSRFICRLKETLNNHINKGHLKTRKNENDLDGDNE